MRHNDEVMLEVSDNGPGIPAELWARVFQRFSEYWEIKVRQQTGLSIVQQISELHGGRVFLDAPKVGTALLYRIFYIRTTVNKSKCNFSNSPANIRAATVKERSILI